MRLLAILFAVGAAGAATAALREAQPPKTTTESAAAGPVPEPIDEPPQQRYVAARPPPPFGLVPASAPLPPPLPVEPADEIVDLDDTCPDEPSSGDVDSCPEPEVSDGPRRYATIIY